MGKNIALCTADYRTIPPNLKLLKSGPQLVSIALPVGKLGALAVEEEYDTD